MNIKDFATRWALHYVNPDFMKIPFNKNVSFKYLVIYFTTEQKTLKTGGYGEYENDYTDTSRQGHLFRQQDNQIFWIPTFYYSHPQDKKKEYLLNRDFEDQNFQNFASSTSSYFIITKPGIYYFLLSEAFLKQFRYYSSESTYQTVDIGPSPAYKIVITEEIFRQYSNICTQEMYERNSYGSDDSQNIYKICLYKHSRFWDGHIYEKNIQENYDVEMTINTLWTTPTVSCRDLALYQPDGEEQSYTTYMYNHVPDYFQTDSFDITIPLKRREQYSLEYVDRETPYQAGVPFKDRAHYSTYDLPQLSNITWHYRKTKRIVQGHYKRHARTFYLLSHIYENKNWIDHIGVSYSDMKRYSVIETGDGDIAYTYKQDGECDVLEFNDDIIFQEPSNLNSGFSGWYPQSDIYYSSNTYRRYSQSDTYHQRYGRYIADYYIYTVYDCFETPYSSHPDSPEDIYCGNTLFEKHNGEIEAPYISRDQNPGGYQSFSSKTSWGRYTYGRDVPGLGWVNAIFDNSKASNHLWDRATKSGWPAYNSAYWYKSGSQYISLSTQSLDFLIENSYSSFSYYIYIELTTYQKVLSGEIDFKTLDETNIQPEYTPEQREACNWKKISDDKNPKPTDWISLSPYNSIYKDTIYPNISQELKEYLGTGFMFFDQQRLEHYFNDAPELVEDELDKTLISFPNPKDVL